MPDETFLNAGVAKRKEPHRISSVAVATVINNIDMTGLGRVQIELPWLPGAQAWARVATLSAGMARGTWFIPQIGDEVLVAFHHGDVAEPFVIGCLWNTLDRPPALLPTDAVSKRIIRSPLGHEIEFDELLQSVTITSTTKQQVKLSPEKVEVSAGLGAASIEVGTLGNISIRALTSLTIDAPSITISATGVLNLQGTGSVSINGALVKIN